MKKKLIAVGAVILYFAIGTLATVNWIHVERLSIEEASYILKSESMFAAFFWWMFPLMMMALPVEGGTNAETTNHEESTENGGSSEEVAL